MMAMAGRRRWYERRDAQVSEAASECMSIDPILEIVMS